MEPLGSESKPISVPSPGAALPARRTRHESAEAAGLIDLTGNGHGYGYGLDVPPVSSGKLPSLAALWRWKWVMLSIVALLVTPVVFCIWKYVRPVYKSTAIIQIDPITPVILSRTPETGAMPFF